MYILHVGRGTPERPLHVGRGTPERPLHVRHGTPGMGLLPPHMKLYIHLYRALQIPHKV